METIKDIIQREQQYEAYVGILPEILQELILSGEMVNGKWVPHKWENDPLTTLCEIRRSFQELLDWIRWEKSKETHEAPPL